MARLFLVTCSLLLLINSTVQHEQGFFNPAPLTPPTVFIRHSLPAFFLPTHHLTTQIRAQQPVVQTQARQKKVNDESVMRKEVAGGVEEAVERIKAKLEEKGFNIFTTVDHSTNAAGGGLELRPTTVIIFGNPNVGTKLMQCAQEYAIDLPQKVLVYEDMEGKVWAAINNQEYLADKHGAMGCDTLVEKVNGKLSKLLGSF